MPKKYFRLLKKNIYETAITDNIVALDVSVYICIKCIYHYEKNACIVSV